MLVNLLDLLYIPIGIVTAPLWMRKKRDGWDERFGHVSHMLGDDHSSSSHSSRPRVLLHAVSVGEVNALRAIVPMLSEQASVIISTTTDTGLTRAQSLFGEHDHVSVVRYPLDCSWMVRRFLDSTYPDVVGLVELEVWPNFIRACSKRGIPIGIINGRLSARSFKGYKKIRWLLGPTFRRLRFACVQDQDYADRIAYMGVPRERIEITGSMKWDSIRVDRQQTPSERAINIAGALGLDLSKPVVVAGSTGPTEEVMLHAAIPIDVQLVIAPRKTDRFDEAAAAVPGAVRRSSGSRGEGATRFVLDTIGELSALYEVADVVVMGRSFNDQFGSDPTEAAALGRPVLIGPRHSDFEQAVGVLQVAGGLEVVQRDGLGAAVGRLLNNPETRAQMGECAQRCVLDQQGASERHRKVLLGFVDHTA